MSFVTTIYMTCGLSDIEVVGNQSMKNGIKYLSESGNQIEVFTFFPEGFRNLQDPRLVFENNVRFHRLPRFLLSVMVAGKRLKDQINQFSVSKGDAKHLNPSDSIQYHEEYSALGHLIYLLFQFLVYLPYEFIRVIWFTLSHGKPDLLYGLNCQGAVVASLLGRILMRPVVTRFHGTNVSERTLASRRERLLLGDQIAGLKAPSRAVITTNDGTRGDIILKLLGRDPSIIRYWMNGVDTDDLIWPSDIHIEDLRRQLDLQGKRVLLLVSRLAVWKRIDRGIMCLRALHQHEDLRDVTLVVVGTGPERQTLETYAQQLEISDSVRFVGGVSHKDMGAYFLAADIFLSLYDRTNLGNPLLEAMYFGRAIVTLADGSTDHLVRDGRSAYLVSQAKIESELPERVYQLLTDSPLRLSFGQEARQAFREQVPTWERRMGWEHELIQQILQTPARTP